MNDVQTNTTETDLTIPAELRRQEAKPKGDLGRSKVQVAEDLNPEVLAEKAATTH